MEVRSALSFQIERFIRIGSLMLPHRFWGVLQGHWQIPRKRMDKGPPKPHAWIEQQAQDKGAQSICFFNRRFGLRVDFETHLRPKSRLRNSSEQAMSRRNGGFALSKDRNMNRRMSRREEEAMVRGHQGLIFCSNPGQRILL